MPSFEYLTSQRGKPKVSSQGYVYVFRRETLTGSSYRCETRTCPGSICIMDGRLFNIRDHTHQPCYTNAGVQLLKEKIKNRALETTEKPNETINKYMIGENQYLAGEMPPYRQIVDGITAVRRRKGIIIPKNKNKLDEEFKFSKNNQNFLFFDNEDTAGHRILIYATYANLIHLSHTQLIVCDGTFFACPAPYTQIYTLMGYIRGKCYPLVYVLMETRTKESYQMLFNALKTHINAVDINFVVDFEDAPISVISLLFPNSKITGCFFHFSQCIWRWIQRNGGKTLYETNKEVNFCMRLVMALAFVPNNKMKSEYEKLLNYFLNTNANTLVVELCLWFDNNFIKNSVYAFERNETIHYIFSVHHNTIKGLPRTQNCLEGWHRSLNKRFENKAPSFFNFFKELQNQQNTTEIKI